MKEPQLLEKVVDKSQPIGCVVFVPDKGGSLSNLLHTQIAAIPSPVAIPRVGEFIFVNMPESPGHHWEVTRVLWHMENRTGDEIDQCSYTTVYVGVKLVPLKG
ncbi:hypothetical protein H6F76_02405 [Leptolyngbya sp. FACHB-321]|uniref:hypothetical protein n=1 Tax=Leptolyngbya sp. FACHB-321 TaxID=2692807 RepID=UPI00168447A4|nr:hypothetical protein [Leptolyngbya sp. FACHB-321]MBD2033905.1 hypothetical protein [Leptolyngbya sp. FACHB-321]